MTGSQPDALTAFRDYFRSPVALDSFGVQPDLSVASGYFRFGEAIGFGRVAGAPPATHPSCALSDRSGEVAIVNGRPQLPFDLSEVVTNLREELYERGDVSLLERSTSSTAVQRLYYALRPHLSVPVRRHLQKARLRGWQSIPFPRWPVDRSVEALMEGAMRAVLTTAGVDEVPFIWFWPDAAQACAMMTHDVEGPGGLAFCDELMNIDDAHGITSAFQLIPEGQETAFARTAARIRHRGFEVNLHDLNHDGRLFADRHEFLARAQRINSYAREFKCDGFRSAVMYRQQRWFDAFEFAYDMSVPNAAHLEPQRGGCCTVMPYFIGNILELPLTTAQDYTLFHILDDYSMLLWRTQLRLLTGHHGLISVITHPDYLTGSRERQVYMELLQLISELRDRERVWVAAPGEVNRWWRSRHAMTLLSEGDGWRIAGPDSERARVAYASVDGDRLVYRFAPSTQPLRQRVVARA